jgi:hypothetical protein
MRPALQGPRSRSHHGDSRSAKLNSGLTQSGRRELEPAAGFQQPPHLMHVGAARAGSVLSRQRIGAEVPSQGLITAAGM